MWVLSWYRHRHLVMPKYANSCLHNSPFLTVLPRGYQVPRILSTGGIAGQAISPYWGFHFVTRFPAASRLGGNNLTGYSPHLGFPLGSELQGLHGQTLSPEGSDCCCCHPAKPRHIRTIAPRLTRTQTQHGMILLWHGLISTAYNEPRQCARE